MNLTELSAFIEVTKQHSFSKASEILHKTQPAVSKQIRRLEEELGAVLFDRVAKTVTLTEAGRALLEPAQRILAEKKNIVSLISNLSNTVSGTLTMGTSHHIGLHRLPPILKYFKESYPEVNLDIQFMDSEKACHLVEKGELELAIVTLPEKPIEKLKTKVIWQDKMCFVVYPGHPLSQLKNVLVSYLVNYPAVLPAKGTYTRAILERTLSQMSLNVSMSTNYLETLKMLVATGMGWSLIPRVMLDDTVKEIKVQLTIFRDLGVVFHRQKTLSNAAQMMLKMTNVGDYL